MNLCVVIPVGPGHEVASARAIESVLAAWGAHSPAWSFLHLEAVNDTLGALGRSAARNEGIASCPEADWYFLLDADDTMMPEALSVPMPEGKDALFGPAHALYWPSNRERKPAKHLTAQPPRDWKSLLTQGPVQSYMMGNFYRGSALRAHLFREDLDHGEDWEHHLSFLAKHEWAVSDIPLALADCTQPSAGGPRGGSVRWGKVSQPFFDYWKKRGRIPLTDEERKRDYWK